MTPPERLQDVLAAMRSASQQCAMFADRIEAAAALSVRGDGWIAVADRLPELGQSVAMIHSDRWENTGGALVMNVRACGYLSDTGFFKYWSIRGQRGTDLNDFTHWMPLPEPPATPPSEG